MMSHRVCLRYIRGSRRVVVVGVLERVCGGCGTNDLFFNGRVFALVLPHWVVDLQ